MTLSADDKRELETIERIFHQLIIDRNPVDRDELIRRGFVFPLLVALVSEEQGARWFPVSGMAGGFRTRVFRENGAWTLVCDSWCRMVGGSGQKHKITRDGGLELLEQGFV